MRVIVDKRGAPGEFEIVDAKGYVAIHEKAAHEGRSPRDRHRSMAGVGAAPLAIVVVSKVHEDVAWQFALRALGLKRAYVTQYNVTAPEFDTREIRLAAPHHPVREAATKAAAIGAAYQARMRA